MQDDFNAFYNDILQSNVSESMPEDIQQRYDFLSCLALDEKKELYLVADRSNGDKGILRVSKGDASDDALIEASILSGLSHPSIPGIIGQWSENNRNYLLREYFEGTTLYALVRERGVLKADQILNIIIELCGILHFLHTQEPKVIHRDIKPENIIITKDGNVKLIDFGIARKFSEGSVSDTQIIGTQPYMAPEQFGSEQTDGRADIYSLGVVMIFLATGKTDKSDVKNQYPYKGLASIILKCIKTDRNQRYKNALQLKRRMLWLQRKMTIKIIICAVIIIIAGLAFVAGFYMGQKQGFEQGVDSIMDSPAVTIRQYTTDELYQEVVFDSWYIDMAVRNILNKEPDKPIYLTEALRVSEIAIYGTNILYPGLDTTVTKNHREKDFVEYWTDNGFVITDRGDVDTLKDLQQLYYLRDIALSSQSISDLTPLTGMKLETLDISNNFVGNLLPLKDMVTLRELDICQNPLNNLVPISRLLSLEYLDISQTQVQDLTPLSSLTKLQTLNMSYCDVSDISVVAEMSRLRELDISNTLVKDLTPLLGRTEPLIVKCAGLSDEVVKQVGEDGMITVVYQ